MAAPAENKIQYGIENLHYALLTEDSSGNITYGTPKPMPGGINLSLSATGDVQTLSADNIAYIVMRSNGGYEGDVEVARIPNNFRMDCLGLRKDTVSGSNVYYETGEPISQRFALLGQGTGDSSDVRFIFYNCTAGRPDIEWNTVDAEDGVDLEGSTQTFPITCAARTGDKLVMSLLAADGSGTYTQWFNTVYVPKTNYTASLLTTNSGQNLSESGGSQLIA